MRTSTSLVALCISMAAMPATAQLTSGPAPSTAPDPAVPATSGSPVSSATVTPDGEENNRVEDIVVTAQRFAQKLQDVPIAITALSAKTMERQGVAGTMDLTAAVPGLVLTKSTFTVQPFLRGVGNSSIIPGSDPSVATYVDGIYQSSANGLLFTFNNIDRIEVLKGPQGTLFGRNATGGLIQIITRDPTTTPTAKVSVGYGNYSTLTSSAYVAGGSGIVAADLAVIYNNQHDGWGRNTFTPNQGTQSGASTVLIGGVPVAIPAVPSKVGTSKEAAVRSKIIITPSDQLTMKIGGYYLYTNSNEGQYRHPLYGAPQRIGSVGQTTPYVYTGGFYDTNVNTPFISRNKQYGANLDLTYDLNFAKLHSITAYQHSYSDNLTQSSDVPYVDASSGSADAIIVVKSYSEELQLLSNPGSPIQWLGGVYLTRIDSGYRPIYFVRGYYLEGGTNRVASNRVDSAAAFAQGSIALWKGARFTLGGRYTNDRITASQAFTGTDAFAAPGTAAAVGVLSAVVPDETVKQHKLTWRASLDQHFTPDLLGYVSVNTGYKAGGFNVGTQCLTSPVGTCPAASVAPPVKPETITAYETGLKTEFFDHRLRANGAVFYYDYKNLQVQTLATNSFGQLLARLDNAASARIYGVDLDIQASVTRHFSLNIGAEYLHARYRDFPNASVSVPAPAATGGDITTVTDASGRPLNRSPKLTLNGGVLYTLPTPVGNLDLSASIYHTSSYYWETSLRLKENAYETVNASASLALPHGLKAKLYARNLFGKEYYAFESATALGDQGAPAAPRTFGGAIEWSF